MIAERLAPAKVNLFLHVGPREADGYHPLASWAVFADVGDRLTLEPAPAWSLEVTGPFAAEIGPGENLVERAIRSLVGRLGVAPPPLRVTTGLLSLIASFLLPSELVFATLVGGALVSGLASVIYSYLVWREAPDKRTGPQVVDH